MTKEIEFAFINIDLPDVTPPQEGSFTPVPDCLPENWTIETFDAQWQKFHDAIDAVFGEEESDAKQRVTRLAEKELLEKPESIDAFISFMYDESGRPKTLPNQTPKTSKFVREAEHDITYHEVDADYRDSGLSLKGEARVAEAPKDYESGHITGDPLSFDHFNFKREVPEVVEVAEVIPDPISEKEMEMLTLAERNLGLANKIAIFFGLKRGLTTEEAYEFLVTEAASIQSRANDKGLVYPVFDFVNDKTPVYTHEDNVVMTEIRTVKAPNINVQLSVGKIASNNGANIRVDFTRGGK